MSHAQTAGGRVVSVWPTENLVACGTPQDSVAAHIYIREVDGEYRRSGIGGVAAPSLTPQGVADYLTCDRWEWDLRPAASIGDVAWCSAAEWRAEHEEVEG